MSIHSVEDSEDQTAQTTPGCVGISVCECTSIYAPSVKCLFLKSVAISVLGRLAKGKGRGREILFP